MMRAKMVCSSVVKHGDTNESLTFNCVSKSDGPYPADGTDENNSFALWSPFGEFKLNVTNPALVGKIAQGDVFYVNFAKIEKA